MAAGCFGIYFNDSAESQLDTKKIVSLVSVAKDENGDNIIVHLKEF